MVILKDTIGFLKQRAKQAQGKHQSSNHSVKTCQPKKQSQTEFMLGLDPFWRGAKADTTFISWPGEQTT